MATKKDYSHFSKEELLSLVEKLEGKKKYGLVWDEERIPEKVVVDCKDNLPVLSEIREREISTDDDDLTHILIEGDNYHALSVLTYTHAGSIDVIYVDPPYNTGKDKEWKFNDQWVDATDTFRHSKWLQFMWKRIDLAYSLLSDQGTIFISIDDNEYHHLKQICDEICGESNFVGTLVWEKKKKGSHLSDDITNIKEYVVVYKKSVGFAGLVGEIAKDEETYPCINPGNGYSIRVIPKGTRSNFKTADVTRAAGFVISSGNMKLTLLDNLEIVDRRSVEDVRIEAEWRYQQSMLNDFASKDSLYFTRDLYLRNVVSKPRYKKLKDLLPRTNVSMLTELYEDLYESSKQEIVSESTIADICSAIDEHRNNETIDYDNLSTTGWGSNEDADNEQRDFFGEKVFDYPKPTKLIKKLIASTTIRQGTVLDFFAGSGTTGQAVIELNHELGASLQAILCTNNEDDNETGLKIAEDICYPRLSKVINGYKRRNGQIVKGIKANIRYFVTSVVKRRSNQDQLRIDITNQCTEMLCLREAIFRLRIESEDWKIFEQGNRYLGVYYNFLSGTLDLLRDEMAKLTGEKILYCFTVDPQGLNQEDFDDWNDVRLEPIPQKILDIYKRIFQDS